MKCLMNRVAVCSVCAAGLLTKGLNVEAATWSGGGSANVWSDAGNWDATPTEGAALTFSSGVRPVNTNDLISQVGLLTLGGSVAWNLTGDASHQTLTVNGITASIGSTLNMNLVLSASQTFSGTGGGLTVNGNVDSNGKQLTINTGSTVTINGDVSGTSSAVTTIYCGNGGATINLNGTANSFLGAINWGRGTLNFKSLSAEGGFIGAGQTTSYGNSINYTGSGDITTARPLRPNINTASYTAAMVFNNNSASSALSFTNRSAQSLGYRTLNLGGTSTGTNLLAASYSSSSSVGITVSGSTWVLDGTNIYSGATSVGPGTLLVTGALASTNAVNVASRGKLGGTGRICGAVNFAAGSMLEAGLKGTGALTLTNSLTFAASATNRFCGALVRVGGDVTLGGATLTLDLADNDFRTNSLFWVVDKASDGAVSGIFSGLPEGAAVGTWGDRIFNITYQADYASGQLTGGNDVAVFSTSAQTVTWNGSGAESLWGDAANWDAAPTNGENLVFGGTLRTVNTNDSLTRVGAVTFTADAPAWTVRGNAVTLENSISTEGTGTIAWSVNTTIEATRAVSVDAGGSLTLGGLVSGAGGLSKAGTGTLTLSGANTFSGPLSVSGGTLVFPTVSNVGGGASALGAPTTAENGVIGLSGGSTLKLDSAPSNQSSDRAVRLSGGAGNYTVLNNTSRKLTLASDFLSDATGTGSRTLYLSPNAGGIELQGAIGDLGPGLVTKLETSGANWANYVVRLSATNSTYSGLTTVGNGTVIEVARLAPTGEPSSIGTGSNDNRIYFAYSTSGGNYGTLRYVGTEEAVCDRPLYLNGYQSAPRTIANNSPNNASLTLSGTISGTLVYNGNTTPIQLYGSSTAINTLAGRVLDPDTANAKRYSVVVNTSGAWALTATNSTYSGGTSVSKGVLLVNNAEGSGTGAGAVTVNAGGTLGGTGTVAGAVSVLAGGTLQAGSGGVGALTLQSGLTFAAGATNSVWVAGKLAGEYTSVLVAGGDVDLGGATLAVDASTFSAHGTGSLVLIEVAGVGTVTGTFDGLPEGSSIKAGNLSCTISYAGGDGNDVVLNLVPKGTLVLVH